MSKAGTPERAQEDTLIEILTAAIAEHMLSGVSTPLVVEGITIGQRHMAAARFWAEDGLIPDVVNGKRETSMFCQMVNPLESAIRDQARQLACEITGSASYERGERDFTNFN